MISLGSLIGVPLLIYGILSLSLQRELKSHPNPLPVWEDISLVKFHLVATKANPNVQHVAQKGTSPKPRFDPQTGKPLDSSTSQKQSVSTPKKPVTPIHASSPTAPSKPEESSPAINAQIYTVLDPDIRARLLNLPLTSDDRGKVAKSFIYLTRDQQSHYLNELRTVNFDLTPQNSPFVRRLYALPLPAAQHTLLLKQLDYLPTPQQEEFLNFLEETISTRS